MTALNGFYDAFRGITVDISRPDSGVWSNIPGVPLQSLVPTAFHQLLSESIDHWISEGIRGVWLSIPINLSEYVPVAVNLQFIYYSATSQPSPKIVLTRWLPNSLVDPNKLPSPGETSLGVGAMVLRGDSRESREILVVTERYFPADREWWKLPGGALDKNEDICVASVRETREETGIAADFIGILGFRHLHQYRFGNGDIYFVALLLPQSISQEPIADTSEISATKYMKVSEFLKLDHMQKWSVGLESMIGAAEAVLESKSNNEITSTRKHPVLAHVLLDNHFKKGQSSWYVPTLK